MRQQLTTSQNSPSFTVGVEEELQIIDPRSRQLVPGARAILDKAIQEGGEITYELRQSQVELKTSVATNLQELREFLVASRYAVHDAAKQKGYRIAASGTHPFSDWKDQPFTAHERYTRIQEEFGMLAAEQCLFGCHVHIDVGGKEAAVATLNHILPWAPTLLALGANSPFWLGDDTGFASYRAILFSRWPSAGLIGPFQSWEDYQHTLKAVINLGGTFDEQSIYWDLRVSPNYGTIEVRIADVAQTVDEAVLLAAVTRACVRQCFERARRGQQPMELPREALRIARWRAARFGLEGQLTDLQERCLSPAVDVLDALLRFIRPALESFADWEEVAGLVDRVLRDGTGAARQRRIRQRGGTLQDVVDALLKQTIAEGTGSNDFA